MDINAIASEACAALEEALGQDHFVNLPLLTARFIQLFKLRLARETGKLMGEGERVGYQVILHRNSNETSPISIQSIEWRLAPGEEVHHRHFRTSKAGRYLAYLVEDGKLGTW